MESGGGPVFVPLSVVHVPLSACFFFCVFPLLPLWRVFPFALMLLVVDHAENPQYHGDVEVSTLDVHRELDKCDRVWDPCAGPATGVVKSSGFAPKQMRDRHAHTVLHGRDDGPTLEGAGNGTRPGDNSTEGA